MVAPLRLYQSPDELEFDCDDTPSPTVRVRLGDLLPLVVLAQKLNYRWLKDFLDDDVKITEDLHEVLQSFRGLRPVA
ncbi:MAG: hypothetical protein U0798_11050 [Gemmataceae bacterium]